MAHKPQLHELLKEDQEPFHLNSYLSQKHSQFKKNSTTNTLQLTKSCTKFKNLCFFSFQNTPDVRKSPFRDLVSPAAMSPCKSSNGGVFLQIPSRTAAILMEAAMKIQKQGKQKEQGKNAGFGLFGSFLKRLKDRSKNKKRAIGNNDLEISRENENAFEVILEEKDARSSCWRESPEDETMDLEASTSESSSPFRFSLHRSPSSSGHRTPEFCSPAASPSRHVEQEKGKYGSENSDNVHGEEEEEKEQCSPVSVLDPPFEDDEQESQDAEEDVYDHKYTGTRQQLLYKLQRFEKLVELDPMELDRKLLEVSNSNDLAETEFVTEVFNQSSSVAMSTDMKRLVYDLIVEEKSEVIYSEVVLGRICIRLDSWKEVEFDTIDMMIELDFKRECNGWKKSHEQVEEIAEEIELEILQTLMEELSEELLHIECT